MPFAENNLILEKSRKRCFVAIRRIYFDGHDYIESYRTRESHCCMRHIPTQFRKGISYIQVKKILIKGLHSVANFSSTLQSILKLVGITGTNGKTDSFAFVSLFKRQVSK
jgi:UDP-N-acetylmuramyl tripeptide synthase